RSFPEHLLMSDAAKPQPSGSVERAPGGSIFRPNRLLQVNLRGDGGLETLGENPPRLRRLSRAPHLFLPVAVLIRRLVRLAGVHLRPALDPEAVQRIRDALGLVLIRQELLRPLERGVLPD